MTRARFLAELCAGAAIAAAVLVGALLLAMGGIPASWRHTRIPEPCTEIPYSIGSRPDCVIVRIPEED